ncbi:uncharacterized protein LOC114874088 [Osmia bicornis bicornis]|uniref:uncharacterized protein LOC114874088 n=1 Tax=Osmia bicornis bicornis TaxID=1437191 RepID=UPI0010F89BDA|nr:uncharacterized protein LOC114874088 [Osmia bicornis bicornis]
MYISKLQFLQSAKIMFYLGKVGVPVGGSHIIFTAVLGRPGPSKFVSLSTLYRDSNINSILISWFVACLIRRHSHVELLRGQTLWPALEASRVPIFGSVAYAADVISGVAAPSSFSRSSAVRRFTTHPHG